MMSFYYIHTQHTDENGFLRFGDLQLNKHGGHFNTSSKLCNDQKNLGIVQLNSVAIWKSFYEGIMQHKSGCIFKKNGVHFMFRCSTKTNITKSGRD